MIDTKEVKISMAEYKLYDLASVIRSKNSGPFQTTLDVLFEDAKIYEAVKKGELITREKIAALYKMDESRIQELVFFDTAQGFKITYDRSISSGTSGDRDVYGAQQHAPLAEMRIEL